MNAPANLNGPTVTVPAVVESKAPLTAGARPKAIVPADMDQVWRFAQIVAKSGLAPKDMQKAETITVAIMHGLEVGLTPLMALQRIAVINGRPSIWGDGAIGLVRASGLCEFVQEMITGDGDNMVAICRAKRKGEKDPAERTFSVQDAKRAGLWGKAGPWQQYPKRMLQMRARAFMLRDLFADVLGGLYIAEELEDVEAANGRPMKDVTPRTAVRPSDRPEMPPQIPQRQPEAQQAESNGDAPQAQTATAAGRKPLPPPARGGRQAARADADEGGVPVFLQRNAPPADQPEAFREWIVAKLGTVHTSEAVQEVWDGFVQPNVDQDQIIPPDLEDLTHIFTTKRSSLAQ